MFNQPYFTRSISLSIHTGKEQVCPPYQTSELENLGSTEITNLTAKVGAEPQDP